MANYFSNFPVTLYSLSENQGTSLDVVTNLITRFAFENSLKDAAAAFYDYEIQDSDTPEIIASKFYNNPERHWIVLMFNDIVDPQYDWPLKYPNFIKYVDEKYAANGAANTTVQSGLAWAKSPNNIHSYYQVNTRTTIANTADKKTIVEKIQITKTSYDTLTLGSRQYWSNTIIETVTKEKLNYYDHELEANEQKRKIKLLRPEYVPQVVEEFKRIVNPQ